MNKTIYIDGKLRRVCVTADQIYISGEYANLEGEIAPLDHFEQHSSFMMVLQNPDCTQIILFGRKL